MSKLERGFEYPRIGERVKMNHRVFTLLPVGRKKWKFEYDIYVKGKRKKDLKRKWDWKRKGWTDFFSKVLIVAN